MEMDPCNLSTYHSLPFYKEYMLIKLSEDDNEAYFPASQALIPPSPPPINRFQEQH